MKRWFIVFFLCRFINADPSGFAGGLNLYAFADGNPVGMIDPFGLGASATASSISWLQSTTPSYITAWQDDVRHYGDPYPGDKLTSAALNLVTLGLAGDVSVALTGYDLYNNRATRQEQIIASVSIGLSLIPAERLGLAGARVATRVERVAAKATIPSAGGVIRQFEQQGAQTYYRVYSEGTAGKWLTAVPPRSSGWAQEALALPPNNSASFIQEVLVPNGTMLERSRAIPVPEWGRLRGGAEQFKLLERLRGENYGPGRPFP